MPRVMNMAEVAEFLGSHRHTIRELSRRQADPLPSHRPTGPKGDRRYIEDEVVEWLKRQDS